MAGIGFRLQKYFFQQDLLGKLKGGLYSVIISTGPWLISVLSIAVVTLYAQQYLLEKELLIFKSIICYTYAASLIIFGAVEMPLTRYLADKLYLNDSTSFKTVFLLFLLMSILLGVIIGGGFYHFTSFSLEVTVVCLAFFVSVLVIWLSMVFLSAAKNYHQIVVSFILGGAISVASAVLLGKYYSVEGYIIGYSIGQGMIAVFLTRNVFSEFSGPEYLSLEVFTYFRKFKVLVFVGLFYYLGIWVDKILFWYSSVGEHVDGPFFTNRFYDTAMFLSYLSIVPTLAMFLVQVETNFYVKYAYYFRSIDEKNNLNFLQSVIREMIESLRSSLGSLLKIQGFVTVIAWYFAEDILGFMNLPPKMIPIFQYGLIGAFLQSLFLVLNIILLYFQFSKEVLVNYLFFFISNTTFSLLSIYGGYRFHGLGYLTSALLTFLLSFYFLNNRLKFVALYTFMRQPLGHKRTAG
jgi:polysaccharide biosynthesis protein PelG